MHQMSLDAMYWSYWKHCRPADFMRSMPRNSLFGRQCQQLRSVVRLMLQLEPLADASSVVVLVLMCVVIANAIAHGLPALHDGSFAIVTFKSFGKPPHHMEHMLFNAVG